jgi:hypothetical protein
MESKRRDLESRMAADASLAYGEHTTTGQGIPATPITYDHPWSSPKLLFSASF